VSDSVAARALVNYHLDQQRPMMGAFLDLLGIPHENGLISEETVAKPETDQVKHAVSELATRFPAEDVSLYLGTLVSQDPDTWGTLADLPESRTEKGSDPVPGGVRGQTPVEEVRARTQVLRSKSPHSGVRARGWGQSPEASAAISAAARRPVSTAPFM
jgi:hypothetical protein